MRIVLVSSVVVALSNLILAVDLTHCRRVEGGSIIEKNVVNLVYTMEAKCAICYEEAIKLVAFKEKLGHFGVNLNIVVGIDRLTNEEKFRLPSQLKNDVDIWTTLGRNNGHAFVLDSCGRVAYQVIAPWSKQAYPYTTMAVLSATFDNPCGACNLIQPVPNHAELKSTNARGNEHLNIQASNTMEEETLEIPIWILFEETHNNLENERNVSHEYVELRINHARDDGLPIIEENESSDDDWIHQKFGYSHGKPSPQIFTEWQIINGKAVNSEKDEALNDGFSDYRPKVEDELSEEMNSAHLTDIQTGHELKEHYDKLVKWKPCADLIMGNWKSWVRNRLCSFS